ncbi:hypothetical protein UlMin_042372 [Ulmus minor]
MKGGGYNKGRGGQHVAFELKHKVVIALNKLSDRDTYQVGVDELEKTAECLTPDGIPPFLSCILDTDSQHKTALRKECIRLMGTLLRFHGGFMGPHLPKMVASIVKRLKDPDSVVRDACLETVGIMASKLSNGLFLALVRPLFEAMGEQNKQLQAGSALCLARIIDNTCDPPLSILHRMLIRTSKLLKNPHFMAKPAVIQLNTSIIQAGGAPTQNVLSSAMSSIQECLKNNDWTTRKAASTALGEIASGGGSFLGPFKASCIQSLESCRFDKVKPVRDTVLQALHCWKTLPGHDTSEPSEAGSSIKENYSGGDYSDLTSESGRKDVTLKKVAASSNKGRIPLLVRKKSQNHVENPRRSKDDDWHIEIAVPKTHAIPLDEFNNEESEGSSVTKTVERMSTDITSMQDIGYEYVHMDDKQECSSVSNLISEHFVNEFLTVSADGLEKDVLPKQSRNQKFTPKEMASEEQIYNTKMQDRTSLDSTVTVSDSPSSHGCCLQIANEMMCIRKHLLQIEDKQSNLVDLLQVFSTGIMENLSMLQSRVVCLENVVDRLSQDILQKEDRFVSATSKLSKQGQSVNSPRLSTCTPRPSIDIRNRQPSLLSMKNTDIWEDNAFRRSVGNNSSKQAPDMWSNTKAKITGKDRDSARMDVQKYRQGTQRTGHGQVRTDPLFGLSSSISGRQSGIESKNSLLKRLEGFLCEGDLDSAYVEALCSGDELALVELLDRTGPVLECLSSNTVSDVLSTLACYLLEQRFINSIIPWLQQVVELSTTTGPNYLVLSTKARQTLLSAVLEAVNMDFPNPLEKRFVNQIAVKLHHIWGKCS